ncbi:Imm49 family immunity protein [Streptomyces sp. enrichment culture]|uniref:Imm49 family immunity protein n=1 Tax=Streptomyces sp. enrichment culture TaxID=1795815 RepID=UPI003F5677B4
MTRHEVSGERLARARQEIRPRVRDHAFELSRTGISMRGLWDTGTDLLDHLAARLTPDSPRDRGTDLVLETAAECYLGVLSVGCFPNGDQEIHFPISFDRLCTFEGGDFTDVGGAPDAGDWVEAFTVCVVSGRFWDWEKADGLVMRGSYAEAIREGVPYSRWTPESRPADLATMDALCAYLTEADGHLPKHWPTVPLRKPDPGERAEAARALDAAGELTPDQKLLRVLLDDDRTAFETALAARLALYPQEVGPDPAPRTLLPLGALALAALALQVHGWEPAVDSPYLPRTLLGSTDAMRRAGEENVNTFGGWVAR